MSEHARTPPVAGEECSVTADDGIRLACEEIEPPAGEKAALTVVLVHGFALDRRTWQEQRPYLAGLTDPPVRVVIYDQRSHGRSERAPQESCTIDQLGRDLDAVIRALAPEGPLVLVSHSMGGMSVMALAEQHPDLFHERVAGVALISTSAGDMSSRRGCPARSCPTATRSRRGLGCSPLGNRAWSRPVAGRSGTSSGRSPSGSPTATAASTRGWWTWSTP